MENPVSSVRICNCFVETVTRLLRLFHALQSINNPFRAVDHELELPIKDAD